MKVLALYLAAAAALFSQSAQVDGRVIDPSGQSVPEADVLVVNDATQTRRRATTNADGLYTVPALAPGPYTISVRKTGFKQLERKGVVLTVETRSRVDVQLELGGVAESVTVNESLGALQVESPEISTTITQDQVQNLPLVQLGRVRVAAAFVYLTVGVHGNVNINGADNLAASNQIRVHGSRTFQPQPLRPSQREKERNPVWWAVAQTGPSTQHPAGLQRTSQPAEGEPRGLEAHRPELVRCAPLLKTLYRRANCQSSLSAASGTPRTSAVAPEAEPAGSPRLR